MDSSYSAILILRANDSDENGVPYAPSYKEELNSTKFEIGRHGIVFGNLGVRFIKKVPKEPGNKVA